MSVNLVQIAVLVQTASILMDPSHVFASLDSLVMVSTAQVRNIP